MLQANDPAWHRLRLNHTLRLALAQKEVVEFPVITIVLPEELPDYKVLCGSGAVQQNSKHMAVQYTLGHEAYPS